MKIAVWGDELAAWVSAVNFAQQGNHVTMVRQPAQPELTPMDSSLRNEPGLEEAIREQEARGFLRACSADKCGGHEIHWLAMAPSERELAEQIIIRLANTHERLLVVNQSNFGIGANDHLAQHLDIYRQQSIAYIPDTLQQGRALQQFRQPTALIIGCNHAPALLTLKALLRPFSQQLQQIQYMSTREAEFTKFAINGMLALRLGYINELANLADQLGVDIELVRQGMGTDERIGRAYLNPGCGFGGQHFTQYIESLAELLSDKQRSTLLETVLSENEKQKELPFRKLWQHYACDLTDKIVSLWGVAFKPGIASIDNAPSLRIIRALMAQGAQLRLHDPAALKELYQVFGYSPQLTYCEDAYQAVQESDALLLLTEWDDYACPDFTRIYGLMRTPLLIDGRNLWEPDFVRKTGFTYYGVGR